MSFDDCSISVVIPAFNSEKTIARAVLSALAQNVTDLECIVIDDCSTDSTSDIVKQIQKDDDRVRYYVMCDNSGSPAAPRNIGINLARGRYIGFLDADDEWLSGKLNKQLSFMEKTGAAISCAAYKVVDDSGREIGKFRPLEIAGYKELLSHNTIGCSTVILDTNKVGKPQFPVCGHEDYALWLELSRRGHEIYGVMEELGVYRVAKGSVSSDKIKVLGFFWNIYRNIEGFSVITSAFYCLRYAWNVRKKYS